MAKVKKKFKMIEEIHEQPGVLKALVEHYVKGYGIIFDEFGIFKERVKKIKRFTFWGLGSSYNAALFANYLFEEVVGLPCECEVADEVISRSAIIEENTAVVVFSQSGETGDIIKAVKLAQSSKALTITVTNNENSTLSSLADVTLLTRAGKEKAVAATKTFTSQLLVLILLAVYLDDLKSNNGRLEIIIPELKTLDEKVLAVLAFESRIAKLAKEFKETEQMVILGRSVSYPIALEAAQKIKETCYIQAEGEPTEEFRHGPIAILDKNIPVIMLMPLDKTHDDNLLILREVLATKAPTYVITTQGNNEIPDEVKDIITMPPSMKILSPIISVVVFQLLAYHVALEKNIHVDSPRNIRKYIK
ncbi:SIS domain-containing protein [Candidatus Parcubacteria bacterium]|nr:SIS domain-containing protein [Candidatus Parcubacteria bacterium]